MYNKKVVNFKNNKIEYMKGGKKMDINEKIAEAVSAYAEGNYFITITTLLSIDDSFETIKSRFMEIYNENRHPNKKDASQYLDKIRHHFDKNLNGRRINPISRKHVMPLVY